MFDNPFLTELKKSLVFEKESMDFIFNKIEKCILEGRLEMACVYSDQLKESIFRYKKIEKLILKEEGRG